MTWSEGHEPDPAASSAALRVAVERTDLMAELDRGTAGRLTLVVAPAGSGKTVTVEQWARSRPEVRWIAAGDRERDVHGFARQLLAVIGDHVEGRQASLADWLDPRGDRLGEQFVDAVLADLESSARPLTLVVDDVDRLGPGVHTDLRQFIAGAPPGVHLVGIARVDPDLGQARLRAYGDAVEIRIEQLRFGPEAARDLLERTSARQLDDAQLATVMSTTEGWPIAVHLAGLALRASDDLDASLASFASSDRNVADFLSEEVFKLLTPEDRDLLVRTSVLPVLDGDLCDAVLGTVGSGGRLDDLERRGVLVIRLPEGRFRLHRLVRAYLRLDLQRIDPQATGGALRAAAAFELARGDYEAAGDHLAEAREWPALRDLVVESGASAWTTLSLDPIRRWIEVLPVEHRDPLLRLTGALIDYLAGYYEAAGREITALLDSGLPPAERLIALNASVAFVSSTASFEQARRDAELARELAATLDLDDVPTIIGIPGNRLVAWSEVHGEQAAMFMGDATLSESRSAIDDVASMQPLLAVNALGGHAVRCAMEGRFLDAESAARRATFIAGELGQRHAARALAMIAMGMVAYARDDHATATGLLADALGIVERWRRLTWVRFVMIEQARVADACGEAGATDLIDHLTALPAPRSSPWMEDRAVDVEARAWWRRGDRRRVDALLALGGRGPIDGTIGLRTTLAIEDGRLDRAAELLGAWPEQGRFDGQLRRLLDGVVGHLDGDPSAAPRLVRLVDELERSGDVRLLVDAGPRSVDVLRRVVPSSSLVERAERIAGPVPPEPPVVADQLVDPLTERELAVLAYLPTRLTNADIAYELYVSVHTIRTHLKHIYQKLGVGTRDEAIVRATAFGLLTGSESPVGSVGSQAGGPN